jgi:hypothetical protein
MLADTLNIMREESAMSELLNPFDIDLKSKKIFYNLK